MVIPQPQEISATDSDKSKSNRHRKKSTLKRSQSNGQWTEYSYYTKEWTIIYMRKAVISSRDVSEGSKLVSIDFFFFIVFLKIEKWKHAIQRWSAVCWRTFNYKKENKELKKGREGEWATWGRLSTCFGIHITSAQGVSEAVCRYRHTPSQPSIEEAILPLPQGDLPACV